MPRWWLSFYFLDEDYRPLHFPPAPGILGYWNSGLSCADNTIALCLLVESPTEEEAKALLRQDWPESDGAEWRFVEQRAPDWRPSGRFPLKPWMQERLTASVPPAAPGE